jgi:hypothetical protein
MASLTGLCVCIRGREREILEWETADRETERQRNRECLASKFRIQGVLLRNSQRLRPCFLPSSSLLPTGDVGFGPGNVSPRVQTGVDRYNSKKSAYVAIARVSGELGEHISGGELGEHVSHSSSCNISLITQSLPPDDASPVTTWLRQ